MQQEQIVYLDIKIHPHRSLSIQGMKNLLIVIGFILFLISFAFFLIGAWPIVGFAGLDFILLYYAFKSNINAAKRFEHILISTDGLTIRKVSEKGLEEIIKIEPNWLQINLIKRKGQTDALRLRTHGQDVFIGSFLNRTACKDLASRIKSAIEEYKNNQNYTYSSSPS